MNMCKNRLSFREHKEGSICPKRADSPVLKKGAFVFCWLPLLYVLTRVAMSLANNSIKTDVSNEIFSNLAKPNVNPCQQLSKAGSISHGGGRRKAAVAALLASPFFAGAGTR